MCIRLNDKCYVTDNPRLAYLASAVAPSVRSSVRSCVLPCNDVKEWAACHRARLFAPRVKLSYNITAGRASRSTISHVPKC
jgi:hypothetical protein